MIGEERRVLVGKGKDPYKMTSEVLEEFPFPNLKGRRVLIKPNAGRVASPGDGVTTHPEVVEAVIDELRKRGAERIAIGESCIFGEDSGEAFRFTGMKEVSRKKGIPLIDLDREASMEMEIPGGRILRRIKVSSAIKNFDFIVSVPVMKTHMYTRVSLGIKNMKGLLWRKEKARFHQLGYRIRLSQGEKALDIALSDMALVLSPQLTVIDGTVGMEGMGPAYGKKKEVGLVVIGNDPIAADAVASRLMGLRPQDIPHLRLGAERGLGEIELSNISVTPKDYLKWESPFEPPPSQFSFFFPDVVIHEEGACSACISTLFLFLNHYPEGLSRYRAEDGKVHIVVGKDQTSFPEGAIRIGNCASESRGKGVFVRGCPPVSSQILDKIVGKRNF